MGWFGCEVNFFIDSEGELLDPASDDICEGKRLILEASPSNENYTYEWFGPDGYNKTGRRATLAVISSADFDGLYTLRVSDGTCFTTVERNLEIVTSGSCAPQVLGHDDYSKRLTLYPNPGTDLLTVSADEIEINKVAFFNVSGSETKVPLISASQKEMVFNISQIPLGIYFLSIKLTSGDVVQKKIFKSFSR